MNLNDMIKIDKGKTMAEMWDGFAGLTIPHVPKDAVQYKEMEKSYYAGALSLFNWFMVQMDEDVEPTDADLALVGKMETELNQFFMDKIKRLFDS